VVASQWAVADTSTATLMISFHQGLRRGLAKDQALQEAMAHVCRDRRTASPYYWAPFILIGDPENSGLGARWVTK
jgi:CHAT domain-containing protein